MSVDFSAVTACGECCTGCGKKADGHCKGCIESDGHCEEWAESKRCPIHKCAREHGVRFCGLCTEFPCAWLPQKASWNPRIVEDLTKLAKLYREANPEN
jgi:hypothetical protein